MAGSYQGGAESYHSADESARDGAGGLDTQHRDGARSAASEAAGRQGAARRGAGRPAPGGTVSAADRPPSVSARFPPPANVKTTSSSGRSLAGLLVSKLQNASSSSDCRNEEELQLQESVGSETHMKYQLSKYLVLISVAFKLIASTTLYRRPK